MNILHAVLFIGAIFFLTEIAFFWYCFRWLANGRREREREFSRLDMERRLLLELHDEVKKDLLQIKQMNDEIINKLHVIGADAHAEWTDMKNSVEKSFQEFYAVSENFISEQMSALAEERLKIEKIIQKAHEHEQNLTEILKATERIIRFFDNKVPAEQIIKDLQAEKYAEALKMLQSGAEPSYICKKFGMSLSELNLLSHLC